jgi:hypothetical protein
MEQSQGGQAVRTQIEILVKAMHILANDIQSDDGVANAAIYEAAKRLEEQNQRIKRLEEAGNALLWYFCPKNTGDISFLQSEAIKQWNKAKEAKL